MKDIQAPWIGMCGEDYYRRYEKPDPLEYEPDTSEEYDDVEENED